MNLIPPKKQTHQYVLKKDKTFFKIKMLTVILLLNTPSIITKANNTNEYRNFEIKATQQNQTKVTGKVLDKSNEPLIGVSVSLVGASAGTITDIDGNFSINIINNNSKLKFSYLGFNEQVITIGNGRILNVVMQEDNKALDEVVVVGYGTVKKTSLTAAISTLKASEISQKPVTNLSNTFAGNIAGVIAQQSSGEPGMDGSTLRIRGSSTTGNGDPLLIVDGVPRSFSNLDPNSIESFTVLKDAAAVAPYGMGGANGVVLVTTKRGKQGAPTLSYNGYVGIQNPTRMPKMVNSYQYALLQNEAARNSGLTNMPFSDYQIEQYKKTVDGAADADPDRYPNSRGLKDVLRKNSLITQHNIELTGGNDFVKYYTSIGYMSTEGQFDNIWSKRYNGQISLDIQATKTTKVSASATGYFTKYHFPGKVWFGASNQKEMYTAANGGILYQGFRTPPTSAIYYSNGLWGSYIGKSLVGYIYNSGYAKREENQFYTTFSIDQDIPWVKGLKLKGLVSYDPQTANRKIWQTPILSYAPDFSTNPVIYNEVYTEFSKPQLNEEYSDRKSLTFQGHVSYGNKFGLHDISLLFVAEARKERNKMLSAERKNFPIDIDEIGMGGVGSGDVSNGGTSWRSAQAGFVFRGTYNYANKYLLELAGRYDGSYYFAPGKRWGFFPLASLAWNLSEEKFISDNYRWVDMIKLRTSYGTSGNLAGENFQYLSGYGIYGSAAYFNGSPTVGIYEREPQANPNITWEKAKKFNIGADLSFWNGLFTLQFDYFYERRSDMLWRPQVLVPEEYGTSMPEINSAKMSNHGIEFEVGSTYKINKDLTIRFNGNFTFAQNKLLEIFETSSTYDNPNRRRTGRANGTQFGYKALGYFTPDDFTPDGKLKPGIASIPDAPVQPGDLKYQDMNGDGIIDSNDETVIGRPNGLPEILYGFTPSIQYKGFDASFLFQGAARVSLPVGGSLVHPFDQQGSASELAYKDHWTPDNTNALYPRVYNNQPAYNTTYSSWWCRDASYIRLKNIEIGYTIPSHITKKFSVQRLRAYVSGQNLWTWTPHIKETLDPEAQSSNGQYYYQQQVFSFGVNIGF
jgi:TonB-linked SusC/RagA family outer membrane protein